MRKARLLDTNPLLQFECSVIDAEAIEVKWRQSYLSNTSQAAALQRTQMYTDTRQQIYDGLVKYLTTGGQNLNYSHHQGRTFIFFDFETTGFSNQSEPIEISLLIVNHGWMSTFHAYILPEYESNPYALQIHCLPRTKLLQLGAKPWHIVALDINTWVEKYVGQRQIDSINSLLFNLSSHLL